MCGVLISSLAHYFGFRWRNPLHLLWEAWEYWRAIWSILEVKWENWIKDQGIFPVVIILIIPITFPLNYVLKMLRGNWWLSLMPTEHYWLILFAFFLILSLGFWHGQFVHLSNKVKNIISSRCHEHKPHNTMHRQSSPRRDCLFGRGARAHFPNSGW